MPFGVAPKGESAVVQSPIGAALLHFQKPQQKRYIRQDAFLLSEILLPKVQSCKVQHFGRLHFCTFGNRSRLRKANSGRCQP
jgi:hypothetical protein